VAGATASLAAPELAEQRQRYLRRNALTLVAHGHGDRFLLIAADWCALHRHRYGSSSVPDGVFHEVAEDLVDLVGVKPGLREVGGGLQPEPIRRFPEGDPAGDDLAGALRNVDELPADPHTAGLDAGHVHQLADEPGRAIRTYLVDDPSDEELDRELEQIRAAGRRPAPSLLHADQEPGPVRGTGPADQENSLDDREADSRDRGSGFEDRREASAVSSGASYLDFAAVLYAAGALLCLLIAVIAATTAAVVGGGTAALGSGASLALLSSAVSLLPSWRSEKDGSGASVSWSATR